MCLVLSSMLLVKLGLVGIDGLSVVYLLVVRVWYGWLSVCSRLSVGCSVF